MDLIGEYDVTELLETRTNTSHHMEETEAGLQRPLYHTYNDSQHSQIIQSYLLHGANSRKMGDLSCDLISMDRSSFANELGILQD